jgi:hypothetical protein
MAITEETTPVSITRVTTKQPTPPLCTSNTNNTDELVARVSAGQSANMSCASPSGVISSVDFVAFGSGAGFPQPSGRFVGGNVNGKCADPNFVPGCIFWENTANKSKHFVTACVTAPCGADACGSFTPIGAGVVALATGEDFSCGMLEPLCSDATCDACCNDTVNAKASVAARSVSHSHHSSLQFLSVSRRMHSTRGRKKLAPVHFDLYLVNEPRRALFLCNSIGGMLLDPQPTL